MITNTLTVGAARRQVKTAERDQTNPSAYTERAPLKRRVDSALLDELLTVDETVEQVDVDALAGETYKLEVAEQRIVADIEKAEDRLQELEDSRADIALEGGDLGKLHRDLREAEQLIATLEAAHVKARKMLADARTVEAETRLRQLASEVKDVHYGGAAEALLVMHDMLAGFCRAADELEEHQRAIATLNGLAEQHGRPELKLDLSRLREGVIDSLGTLHADVAMPVRNGESDEVFEARLLAAVARYAKLVPQTDARGQRLKNLSLYRACREMHVEQYEGEEDASYAVRRWRAAALVLECSRAAGEGEAEHHVRVREQLARLLKIDRQGESDEAYGLRLANAKAQQHSRRAASDPLRVIGEAAIDVIRQHVLGLDAHALRRQHPTVKLQRPGPGDAANEPFAHARFVRR